MGLIFLDNVMIYYRKSAWLCHTSIDVTEGDPKGYYCTICWPVTSVHIHALVDEKGKPTGEIKIENWHTHKKVWKRKST